jgi:flagellar biosynthesis/type III secretory pathway protein FliH
VLITISRDEVERARLLSEYKYEVDMQSHIVNAKREGERIGRQEGERRGRQEGEQRGTQRGRQEGRQERNIEILKLIDAGYTPDQIRERLKADTDKGPYITAKLDPQNLMDFSLKMDPRSAFSMELRVKFSAYRRRGSFAYRKIIPC